MAGFGDDQVPERAKIDEAIDRIDRVMNA